MIYLSLVVFFLIVLQINFICMSQLINKRCFINIHTIIIAQILEILYPELNLLFLTVSLLY